MKNIKQFFIFALIAVIAVAYDYLFQQGIGDPDNQQAILPAVAFGVAKGAYGIGKGIHQAIKAKKLKPKRPVYNIPKGIQSNVNQYENLSQGRMPGQSEMEGRLDQSAATALSQASRTGGSAANRLAAIGNISGKVNEANIDMGIKSAQHRNLAADKLAGARNTQAEYEDQAFQVNKMEPYGMDVAKKTALGTAATANIAGGLQGMSDLSASGDDEDLKWKDFGLGKRRKKAPKGTINAGNQSLSPNQPRIPGSSAPNVWGR